MRDPVLRALVDTDEEFSDLAELEGATNVGERQWAAVEEGRRQATSERYDALKLRLAAAYQKLTPADTDQYLPGVRAAIKIAEWPQVKRRLGGWIVAGVALMMAAAIWQYYGPLLAWWQKLTG